MPRVELVVLVGADDELAAARALEDDGRADEVEVGGCGEALRTYNTRS